MHKGPSVIPILSRINPIPPILPISLRSIVTLSSHLRLGLTKSLCPAGVTVKIFERIPTLFHPGYKTCPSQFLDLITRTILGERYKL